MKQKIIKNIIIIFILCLLTLTYLFNYDVQARNIAISTSSQVTETQSEEIIRYDVKTNTSTIVNMKELEEKLANQNNGKIKTVTDDSMCQLKNVEKPLSVDEVSATKLDNSIIRQAPYRYVCRLTYKGSGRS